MTTKKSVSPEDAALFRRAVGPVRTVDDSRPAQPPAPMRKARPKPRDARLPAAADPSFSLVEAGERLSYASAGVPARVLRELRRGRYPVEDEVHLRGMRAAEALRAAGDFIRAARADGLRYVRIVHGKGLASADHRPVIKGEIDHWLRRHDAVDAFCSAREIDGGSGALYVLLRRARDS